MRLIDADALLADLTNRQAVLVKEWGHRDHYTRGFVEAVERVQKASTLEAVEVIHGRWEYNGEIDDDGNLQARCSCCGAGDKHTPCMVGNVPFCWKCGAKMDLPNITEQTVDALNRMGEKAHGGE